MRIFKSLAVLALAMSSFQGCSSSTSTPNPVTPTSVTYTVNAAYTYKQNRLDTANGAYGQDKMDPTMTDTITSTVVALNQTFQLKTGVTYIQNKHSLTGLMDTTYIAQENGNYWHYNYGLESVNNNPAVIGFIGAPVQNGWVLQAKLGAVKGDTWLSDSTTVTIGSFGNADLTLHAVEQADTTIMVNGASVAAKHVFHTLVLKSFVTVTGYVDTYVSASTGMTLNVVHSSAAIPPVYNKQISGSQTLLLSH